MVYYTLSHTLNKVARIVPTFVLLFFAIFSSTSSAVTIKSYSYILQAEQQRGSKREAIAALSSLQSELIIIDSFFAKEVAWTADDLRTIRAAHPGRRIICYLSIGEAEEYRSYWQSSWSQKPPLWLHSENPNWPGNFKVKYWEQGWQKLLMTDVDRIMAQGFDGLFLDIVDGFEFFERDGERFIDGRLNEQTQQSYRRDMVDLVTAVARRARMHREAALIVPQNGIQLLREEGYAQLLSAQALEDLYTLDNALRSKEHVEYVLSFAKDHLALPILTTEYPQRANAQKFAREKALYYATVLLITDRALTQY